MAVDAYIGLGSNIGDRVANLADALARIDTLDGLQVLAVSHAYESEPWGVTDQARFVNAAARVRTVLPADELLGRLKEIETALGREPGGERWGPRVIDLDILLYGHEEWASEALTIPHPRMGERDFVVRPLLEVAPEGLRYPDGRPISRRGWLGRCTADFGALPGFEDRGPDHAEEAEMACELAIESAPLEAPADLGDWRTVATTAGAGRLDTGAASIAFKESVLKREGIPFAYDPHPPAGDFNPWGLRAQIKLKVPPGDQERAMAAIAAAEEAESGD